MSPSSAYSPTRDARAFLQDLDNKNAVVARLEAHIQGMIEQQRRQKLSHDAEIGNIEAQLQQAVTAHRQLMQEYRSTSSELAAKQSELALVTSELRSVRESLGAEVRKRDEAMEQHLAELEEKIKTIRGLREKVNDLEDQLARSKTKESAIPRMAAAAEAGVTSSLQLAESTTQNQELLATVERLRRDVDTYRDRLAEAQTRYATELQEVTKTSMQANERAVQQVTNELHKMRHQSDEAAAKERTSLETQLREAKDTVSRLQGQMERESTRSSDRIQHLESEVKRLQEAREAMLEESRFQTELNSDNAAERASLKAEINSLKAALNSVTEKRLGTAPAPAPQANVSHGAGRGGQSDTSLGPAVEAMQESVASATGNAEPTTDRAVLEKSIANLRERLVVADTQLSQKDATIAELRGMVDSQKGAIETLREELRDTRNREPKAATPPPPADGLQEKYEELESTYLFETGELRKQLNKANDKIKVKDGDIAELRQENEELTTDLTFAKDARDHADDLLDSVRAQLDEREAQLKAQKEQWTSKVEALSKSEKELTDKVADLREKLDAAELSTQEMEQALSDALAAAAPA